MYKRVILQLTLILYSTKFVRASREESVVCCPPGYSFLPKHITCWNQITNTSAHVSLNSNHTAVVVESPAVGITVDANGQLLLKIKNREPTIYASGSFCMATHTATNKKNETKTNQYAVVIKNNDNDRRIIDESIRGYGMLVSACCLFATAVVYACRMEFRTMQGLSIVNLCLSLGTGLGILSIVILMSYSDMTLCAVRGFLVYFFLIVSFFWMNVIALQALRSTRCSDTTSERLGKYFLWCALYAWGIPIGLTTIMAIVNFMPGDHLKPGIGLNHCWFFDLKQQWIYMYSVMAILIAVNVAIFFYVTYTIWFASFSRQKTTLKYKILMTMKLFVITGVPWIHELISSALPHHVVWDVMDILNSLQGASIFFVLVIFPLLLSEDDGRHYDLNIVLSQSYTKINTRKLLNDNGSCR